MRLFKRRQVESDTNYSLSHFDSLYATIVTKLSVEVRAQYCENLIGRTKEDLALAINKEEVKYLRSLLIAAQREKDNLLPNN